MFSFTPHKGLFTIALNGADVYRFGIRLNRSRVTNEYFSCVLNLE